MGHLSDPKTGTDSNAVAMAIQMHKSGPVLMGAPGASTFVGLDLMRVPGVPGAATDAQENVDE